MLKRFLDGLGWTIMMGLATAGTLGILLVSMGDISVKTSSPQFSPSNPNTVTVTVDGGGSIMQFYQKYTDMRLSGKSLRVEGLCASACTFFLGLMPKDRVCATDYAHFGFHDVYTMFGPDFETYKWFMPKVYPDSVLKRLRDVYGFDGTKADVDRTKYPGGIIWMTREELNIQECPTTE